MAPRLFVPPSLRLYVSVEYLFSKSYPFSCCAMWSAQSMCISLSAGSKNPDIPLVPTCTSMAYESCTRLYVMLKVRPASPTAMVTEVSVLLTTSK